MDTIIGKIKKPITGKQVLNMIHVDEHGHSIFKPDNELVDGKEIDLSNLTSNLLPAAIGDWNVKISISCALLSSALFLVVDPSCTYFIIESDGKLIFYS